MLNRKFKLTAGQTRVIVTPGPVIHAAPSNGGAFQEITWTVLAGSTVRAFEFMTPAASTPAEIRADVRARLAQLQASA